MMGKRGQFNTDMPINDHESAFYGRHLLVSVDIEMAIYSIIIGQNHALFHL